MRKFLFILACAFSFCPRAETIETNIVYLSESQLNSILDSASEYWRNVYSWIRFRVRDDGSLQTVTQNIKTYQESEMLGLFANDINRFLHLFMTGDFMSSYDTSSNNILAYASSLRGYLNSYSNSVYNIVDDIRYYLPRIWQRQLDSACIPQIQGLYNDRFYAGNKVLELINLSSNNFERLYEAITNIDFKVSISNQIDLLQVMNGNLANLDGVLQDWSGNQQANFGMVVDHMHRDHDELMEFLHSLSNGAFFASNMLNCCGCANSNFQDSVMAMLDWMTNNFPDSVESPIGGGGGSNDVWSVWRPDGGSGAGWNHLFVPSVKWVQDGNNSQQFKPRYNNQQYDTVYNGVWDQYANLLQEYRASGIDGQQFLAGLVDLQLHILANMSTQLYMIDSKMPSKTNLWDSINDETNWVRDNAESVKSEVEGQQYQVQNLLNKADTSIISTYFPKVQTAISRLNTTSNDPVVRLPLPAVFGSGSGSSVWTIDVREIQGHDRLRKFIRWVCIIVWSIIFVRTFIVPSLVILCLCARFSDMACGLLFVDSLDGCHAIGETVGGLSEFILNLIGLDTNLKRWAVGVSTI